MSGNFKNLFVLPLLALLIFFAGDLTATAQIVNLPVTIDYPLLQNLIVSKAFHEKNESVILVNEGAGCIYLALSHPKVMEEKGFIRLEIELSVRAGTPLMDECLAPLVWSGYLVLYQRPEINNQTWQLSFKTYRSALFGSNRQPAEIAGVLWQLIESRVFDYLNSITIDLAPPVNNLKAFLMPLFPPQVKQQTQAMLDSLRIGETAITPKAVTVQILADVHEVYRPEDARFTETLSDVKLDEVVAVWEQWDSLLSLLTATMAKDLLTPEERQTLMDVLLETRYTFVENLDNKAMSHDFVRSQFSNAWKQLSPIFRNHLSPGASAQSLGYFSFFTAADALTVLDGLGPTFGIEMSRNGLIRLAKMISNDPSTLRYSSGVNPDLQHLFEIDSAPVQAPDQEEPPPEEKIIEEDLPLPPASSALPEEKIIEKDLPLPPASSALPEEKIIEKDLPLPPASSAPPEPPEPFAPPAQPEPTSQIFNFFCAPLYAAEGKNLEKIGNWKVPETNIDVYIMKVVQMLNAQTRTTLKQKKLPPSIRATFRLMIPAMAWQESCFRQFVVRDNQLTYLLSSNNSSVGLMQVNMRVWRGLYDLQRLRWDIRYNAAAGCEIAALYLKDYGLRERKGMKRPDNETMARLVYAMYNGGPAQYKKYLARERSGKLYGSDKLFWEKYEWVSTASWDKISKCLLGG